MPTTSWLNFCGNRVVVSRHGAVMNVSNRDIAVTIRANYPTPATADTGAVGVRLQPKELPSQSQAQRRESRPDPFIDAHEAIARAQANRSSSGMRLGDVSGFSEKEAKGSLATIEKLISLGGAERWAVSASNGDQSTNSLNTLADWLRERVGAGTTDPSEVNAGALLDVSA